MRWLLAAMLVFVVSGAQATEAKRVVSPGGIEAWLIEEHSIPMIATEIAFKGGSSQDPETVPGVAAMLAGLLDEGAGPLDSQAFQGKLEDLAIQLAFDAGKDNFRAHLTTLTRNRDTAFDLMRLALTQPRFDAEPMTRVRAQMQEELAQQRQSPDSIVAQEWFRQQFPHHPYGRPTDGTEASVKSITKARLSAYLADHLARDVMVVGVAGDITPEELAPLLDKTFGGLPATAHTVPVADVDVAAPGKTTVIRREIPQSVALFGSTGLKRDDPDWFAGVVMNYILGGGGFSSWLTDEIREKRGLAYSVYTYLQPLRHAGILVGGVATRNEKLGQSLTLVRQQWARMLEDGPSDQELADAKAYLIGSFPLQLDSTRAVASLLVQLQLDRLGIDYLDHRAGQIAAVTKDDVKRAAKRLLNADALSVVIVGKPEGGIPGVGVKP